MKIQSVLAQGLTRIVHLASILHLLRRAEVEGNLWVGPQEAGKLVKVDDHTGKVTEYFPPTEDSGPLSVDVDTTRNLIWLGEGYAD